MLDISKPNDHQRLAVLVRRRRIERLRDRTFRIGIKPWGSASGRRRSRSDGLVGRNRCVSCEAPEVAAIGGLESAPTVCFRLIVRPPPRDHTSCVW